MMKLVKMTAAFGFAALVTACGVAVDEDQPAPDVEAAETTPSAIKQGGTGGTKTKQDLINDGYTCSELEGTTLTLCWKGSSTYSCDQRGNCIETRTQPPPPKGPIVVGPLPTVIAPVVVAP